MTSREQKLIEGACAPLLEHLVPSIAAGGTASPKPEADNIVERSYFRNLEHDELVSYVLALQAELKEAKSEENLALISQGECIQHGERLQAELASASARADRGLQAVNAAQISHGETLRDLEHTKAELASIRERTIEECAALVNEMISDWRSNKDVQSVLASVVFGIRALAKPVEKDGK
jgi:hypothetical protein